LDSDDNASAETVRQNHKKPGKMGKKITNANKVKSDSQTLRQDDYQCQEEITES
jgi:hypothetical protein